MIRRDRSPGDKPPRRPPAPAGGEAAAPRRARPRPGAPEPPVPPRPRRARLAPGEDTAPPRESRRPSVPGRGPRLEKPDNSRPPRRPPREKPAPPPAGRTPGARAARPATGGTCELRLNRYLAQAGLCSRREADQLISAGRVRVNGAVVAQLGTRVMPGDQVVVDGQVLAPERKVYLVLNKPAGYVTTTEDPHAEHTVMELVRSGGTERLYPVGRLDKDTTGVLLLTNDGDLARQLTHPSFEHTKVYHVLVNKEVKPAHMEALLAGFELEDGFIKADVVQWVDLERRNRVQLELHSGRNRVVRRMFEHLGYRVTALDRVSFAGITKKGLQLGQWRPLTATELRALRRQR